MWTAIVILAAVTIPARWLAKGALRSPTSDLDKLFGYSMAWVHLATAFPLWLLLLQKAVEWVNS